MELPHASFEQKPRAPGRVVQIMEQVGFSSHNARWTTVLPTLISLPVSLLARLRYGQSFPLYAPDVLLRVLLVDQYDYGSYYIFVYHQ